jgi:hypothetical protein
MVDRLFSALGQDILELLFCADTLERKENGRSKVLRPFLTFLLALGYTGKFLTGNRVLRANAIQLLIHPYYSTRLLRSTSR